MIDFIFIAPRLHPASTVLKDIYLAIKDIVIGKVPMSLPPIIYSALLSCPFHQKNTPIIMETSNINANMKYSSHPNFSIN